MACIKTITVVVTVVFSSGLLKRCDGHKVVNLSFGRINLYYSLPKMEKSYVSGDVYSCNNCLAINCYECPTQC